MPSRLDERLRHPAVPALLWAVTVTVVAVCAGRFWIPLDDGTLAQSAERVLRGELPHRDFGDPYTGLNAMLGALAFKLFGVRLSSLRIPLVVGFAVWVPALWLVSRSFLSRGSALVATTVAATLSVLTYPAAMPTWFGLFLVTWGVWLLLEWDVRGGRWRLVGAGLVAGGVILFKVVGLYYLAAALLVVALRRGDGSRAYAATVTLGVGAFLALLGRMVLPRAGVSGAFHFFGPSLALGIALLRRSWRRETPGAPGTPMPRGVGPLLVDGAVLCAAAAAPLALYLIPYFASGSVTAWVEGVFLLPGRRFDAAASPPGSPWTVVPGVVAVALSVLAARLTQRGERRFAVALAALLALGLAVDDAAGGAVMATLWYGLRSWTPALVMVGAMAVATRRQEDGSGTLGPAFAVLAVAALWTLVQFPYTAPAYFFYVAPLGVLASAAATRLGVLRPGPVLSLTAAIALFLGGGYATGVVSSGTTPLASPRGGILVPAADALVYDWMVERVDAELGPPGPDGGRFGLWAGPDAPEVYFLTGVPNPTATLYEFLDPAPRSWQDLERIFAEYDIRVVVVNTRPLFSRPLAAQTLERIVAAYPKSDTLGSWVIRWRSP